MKIATVTCSAIVALAGSAVSANPLPAAVVAMLEDAGSDAALLQKVAGIAKRTNPDSTAEIDAQVAAILKTKTDARALEMASWGPFDGWGGSGEVGAFASAGNTRNSGVALAGRLARQGPDWKHGLRGVVDYQRENGRTSKERYFAGYEGNYSVSPRAYALLTGSYERDRFSGFDHRFAESIGFGYKVIDRPTLKMAFEGGPALRQTRFINGVDDLGFAFRSAGNIR
jgi:putative salt-induced outer membrane protein